MAFTNEQIQQVWEKGRKIDQYDPEKYRQDPCGAWICREKYGNTDSAFGWEIDHVFPRSMIKMEGTIDPDDLVNLRPMNWMNNRSKKDCFPIYTATITSSGNRNVRCERTCCVSKSLSDKLKEKYGD